MGIPFNENGIDRAHGIRQPFLDKERKKKVRSIIVNFKSWKVRATFFKARPKNYVNGRKKPGLNIIQCVVRSNKTLLLVISKGQEYY